MAVDDIRSTNNIKSLRIGLASPEKIISWSHGEVKKPETFNYRTYKPEKDGLFCERIFGPVKDYECACGKYKKKRYKAVVCERCGVEVTSNRVRREHLGHIRLASPVAHIWFTKSIPNRFSALLGISGKEIEKVIYFVSWLVADVDEKWVEEKHDGIKALVEKRLKELDSEQLELRNLAQLDLFEEAKTAEGLESARKREITMLGKALRGDYGSSSPLRATAPREHNGKYEEKLESLKDLLLSQEVLKPYILAGEVVDRDTGEVIAVSKDRFNYALLSKVIYLGKYELTVEKVEMEIEATKRIEEIEGERRAIVSALDLIKSMKPLDRLTDQEHEDYNALRMFCLMRDMGDLDEHFHIGIGALVVQESLRKLDLPGIEKEIMGELEGATSAKKQKLIKRLKVVRAFLHSGNRPEWMILTVLPVLPPELRPMVELEGGRFASSDLNDLYRRVINRNNRLKKLIDIRAPESILRNERRMLQEAVDALIDNGRKGRAAVNVNNRALKSLSDMLKGKQGRFRQNLLGKRVDYSGRSVIVVGPKLRLHQCGLPKYMALELFKPFVLNKLIDPDDPNQHIATARRTLERAEDPRVWDALEEITRSHPVLLNRAPTLHRLSMQAFEPVLIEGKAIQLHPLTCAAYNADFDGDQMAVHVPLSTAAQAEARLLMLSSNNLLLPADGKPIISPTKDMVLGIYYMTQVRQEDEEQDKLPAYIAMHEALIAYEHGHLGLQQRVRVPIEQKITNDPSLASIPKKHDGLVSTTIGRIIFNMKIRDSMDDSSTAAPQAEYPLPYYNFVVDRGAVSTIISEAYQECGPSFTARLADAIKDLGFEMATVSGITISASDIVIPREKKAILSRATKEADDVWSKRKKGIITEAEKDLEVTRIWDQATKDLTKAMRDNFGRFNSVYMMAESGARGKMDQVRQLAAMRGLLVGPSGRVLDFPIKSNFREGLSVFEYFISTHGGRKGLVDTALKTADSGYLTRRLIDVSLDVSVTTNDCGTKDGIELDLSAADSVKKLKKMLVGRTCAQDLVDKKTGETVLAHDDEIDNSRAEMIHILQPPTLKVRSVLACQKLGGVCVKCYGWDLASGKAAQVGDPVGVIAAQSIGEPGTQLTMRTFHTGGIKGRDITQGLPYVEMLFEVRGVKMPSILADEDGEVVSISEMVYERITVQSRDEQKEKVYDIVHPYKERLRIHFRSHVERDSPLDNAETVLAEFDGIVTQLVENKHKTYWIIKVKVADGSEHEYETAHENRRPLVAVGEKVKRGDQLCEGDLDLRKFHALLGDLPTQLYITNKIQEIYESQNVNTNSKHIEVIAKQMIRYVEITNPGDEENLFEGDLVDKTFFRQLCQQRAAEGKKEPEGNSLLQGISKSSLSTESFLAAASFQETTRVLTEAAIEGKIDNLKGLKENVIIGGLIPVGTGWHAVAHEEAAFQAVFGAKKRPAKEKPPAKDDKPAEKVF
ncbi:DNA-directed RNA polymerase subunit beta' [bacterium]|nr:DNA-directed RNA polymerase subunit beta' [bacterium]